MTGWRYLNVEKKGEKACIVEVTNSPKSLTGEHKVKISTLMISTKVCPSPPSCILLPEIIPQGVSFSAGQQHASM